MWRSGARKIPQLQVVVDPDRLRANGVTLDMVLQTVRDATAVGAGGFVDTANQRLAIRHIPPVYSPEGLGEVVVAYRSGAPLRIRDVAEVIVDHPPPIGDAIINSRPGPAADCRKAAVGQHAERDARRGSRHARTWSRRWAIFTTTRPSFARPRSSSVRWATSATRCCSAACWSSSCWCCSCSTGGRR